MQNEPQFILYRAQRTNVNISKCAQDCISACNYQVCFISRL